MCVVIRVMVDVLTADQRAFCARLPPIEFGDGAVQHRLDVEPVAAGRRSAPVVVEGPDDRGDVGPAVERAEPP